MTPGDGPHPSAVPGGAASPAAGDRQGALWLLADMALVVAMVSIVKAMGATYPAVQLVFLRCLVGLVLVAPLAWRERQALLATRRRGLHLVRVGCNAVALTCSFTAVAALPLAVVTSIGFTRPLIVLALAALLLREAIGRRHWVAAGIGFAGVLVMARPEAAGLSSGLAAAVAAAVFGSGAVIATRRLKGEPAVSLMAFYTLALTALTAVPAALVWHPVAAADLPALLAIGVLAQVGQYCFVRAHHLASAGVLAPLGYLHLVLAAVAGFVLFGERPTAAAVVGAAIIVAATALAARPPGPGIR